MEEEYELMDIYALVAAVGGSMGIFLGWSLLSGADVMVGFLRKIGILS